MRSDPPGAGVATCRFLILSVIAAMLPAVAAAADPVFTPYEATYEGKISVVPVRAELTLSEADGVWRFVSTARTRGWAAWKKGEIEEASRFRLGDGRPQPLSFTRRDGFSEKDRNLESRFETTEVVSLFRGEELREPLTAPAYDLLTLRLVLRLDLAGDRLAPRYDIIDSRGRLRPVEVRRLGEERIRTGMGEVDTVKLEYVTGSDRRLVVWMAPAWAFEVVRLEQFRDGKLRGWLSLRSRSLSSQAD